MAKSLSPEAQHFAEEFLAERSRQRSAMIEQAGFPSPMPPEAPRPAVPPVLHDEDRLAEQILARVSRGLPTTADERLYIRQKLFAVPGADIYVPSPIRAMPSQDRLLLDARLATIDRAARFNP